MQRKATILAAAAAMAVGTMAFAQDPGASGTLSTGAGNASGSINVGSDNVGSDHMNRGMPGNRQVSPAAKDVRDTISEATSAAVQGKFSDMEKRFTRADRDRLGDNFKDNQSLRDKWTQFSNDWKAKYNQDFDSGNIAKALDDSNVQVYQGEYMGRARTAGERMGPGSDNRLNTNTNANTDTRTNTGSDINRPNDTNSENRTGESNSGAFARDNQPKGDAEHPVGGGSGTTGEMPHAGDMSHGDMSRTDSGHWAGSTNKDTATIFFASSHNLAPAWAVLRNEGGLGNNWKIDVPDTNPQTLSDTLAQHVTMLQDQKANWPSDVNDAYRMVTHHVLTALTDASGGASMNRGGDMDRNRTGTGTNDLSQPGQTNSPR